MTDIRLEHICKSFSPDLHALDDVTLAVKPGECLAIVGPSGCGKTTLLRVIAGLERQTSGQVQLGGVRADPLPGHERDVAMLFQRPALVPNQTVRQNLRWAWTLRRPWLRFIGADRARDADLVQLASRLGLEHDLDRPVQQLSGGQQQRVALGRCLLREAKICLLDEPLGHLDVPLRTELRRLIRDLGKERGMTMLFVTHDPAEAFAFGDRVAVMQAGRIVQVDEPAQMLRHPVHRFVAELAHHDRGGLNCLSGRLDSDAFVGPFGRWPVLRRTDTNTDFSANPSKLLSKDQAFPIIMGIAAEKVVCSPVKADDIQITLRVVRVETSPAGTWVIGRDERGQLIASAGNEQSCEAGQTVTMTFSMHNTYGFHAATGETIWSPG